MGNKIDKMKKASFIEAFINTIVKYRFYLSVPTTLLEVYSRYGIPW